MQCKIALIFWNIDLDVDYMHAPNIDLDVDYMHAPIILRYNLN